MIRSGRIKNVLDGVADGDVITVRQIKREVGTDLIKLNSISAPSPLVNGMIYYDGVLKAFNFYHDDSTGNTYNFSWSNSRRYMSVYSPSTVAPTYGFQFVTSDNTGIGFAPNGTNCMGITSTMGFVSKPFRIGSTIAPTAFVHIVASTTAMASMNLTQGAAPSAPNDGDIWREDNTNTGLKIRINGVTKTVSVV